VESLDGIDFEGFSYDFPLGSIIQGGQSLVVVADLDAFAIRYPNVPSSLILGPYQGGLGNGGDRIILEDADGVVIADFRYDDDAPFPTQADGDGATLELINATPNIDYNDPSLFRASLVDGGTPGVGPNLGFLGNPSADIDGDGVNAFFEFFAGTSDLSAGEAEQPVAEIVEVDGIAYGAIRFQRANEAEAISFFVENSTTLDNDWQNDTILFSETSLGNGRSQLIYRQTTPISEGERQFLRLRIEQ